MKHFRVMTFWHADEGKKPYAVAYLRDASEQWKGCVAFDVEALNGSDAKRIACAKRRRMEERKAGCE